MHDLTNQFNQILGAKANLPDVTFFLQLQLGASDSSN